MNGKKLEGLEIHTYWHGGDLRDLIEWLDAQKLAGARKLYTEIEYGYYGEIESITLTTEIC